MATHILSGAERIAAAKASIGDYLIHEQRRTGELPWRVSTVGGPYRTSLELLGAFASKALAQTFVLAHEVSGWEDDGILRDAVHQLLVSTGGVPQEQALERLSLALETTEANKPRVLAVTDRGVTRLHASRGVDAVAIDCGVLAEFSRADIMPLHDSYAALLKNLGINWPVSPDGRLRQSPETSPPPRPRTSLKVAE